MKKIRSILFLLFITITMHSCKKKGCTNPYAKNYTENAKEDNCMCEFYVDEMSGNYNMTVTYYPLQPSQEGYTYTAHFESSYLRHAETDCHVGDFDDVNILCAYEFHMSSVCETYRLEGNEFIVENSEWASAPMDGRGVFSKGKLSFEGTVHTSSSGDVPLRLEGIYAQNQLPYGSCNCD